MHYFITCFISYWSDQLENLCVTSRWVVFWGISSDRHQQERAPWMCGQRRRWETMQHDIESGQQSGRRIDVEGYGGYSCFLFRFEILVKPKKPVIYRFSHSYSNFVSFPSKKGYFNMKHEVINASWSMNLCAGVCACPQKNSHHLFKRTSFARSGTVHRWSESAFRNTLGYTGVHIFIQDVYLFLKMKTLFTGHFSLILFSFSLSVAPS